jgi:hypothetical protein
MSLSELEHGKAWVLEELRILAETSGTEVVNPHWIELNDADADAHVLAYFRDGKRIRAHQFEAEVLEDVHSTESVRSAIRRALAQIVRTPRSDGVFKAG